MCRPILILGAFAVLFTATVYSQRVKIIYPTYRPPPSPPRYPIRIAREAGEEHLPLNRNETPLLEEERQLPSTFGDANMDPSKRHTRSLSTPSRNSGRASGSSSKSSRGHDTGATHPGYNRRNAREVKGDFIQWPSTKNSRVSPSTYHDVDMEPRISRARIMGSPSRVVLHPGHNQRYTRSLHLPTLPPFNPRPRPWNPPTFPLPGPQRPRFPIYV